MLTVNKAQTLSMIDNLSEGFRSVHRRPWLLLIPLALNLYLWFGVQLSFAPLMNELYTFVQHLPRDTAADGELLQMQYEQLLAVGQMDMWRQIAVLNYVPALTPYAISSGNVDDLSPGLPIVEATPQFITADRPAIVVSNGVELVLVVLAVNLVALLLSGLFLVLLAASVRGDQAQAGTVARRAGRAALALLGYLAVFFGVLLVLGLPFLFFAVLLLRFSPAIGVFLLALLSIVLFWVRIYIGFAPEAIAVSGIGPLRAIHASFNIVRRNFWGTLGFLALTYIISVGAGVIWQSFIGNTPGLIAAVAGGAYLGSGLLAARMAFYRERLRRWQAMAAPVRTSA